MGLEWETCLADGLRAVVPRRAPARDGARAWPRSARSTARNLVWWEPQQFAGGQKLETFFEPVPGERQLGFSWHNYCPDVFLESQGIPGGDVENCWAFSRDRNQHALDQSRTMRRCAADERVGCDRQPAGDRDRRGRRRRAPHGLAALGLQALERPDHGRRRPGPVPRRRRPLQRQAGKLRQLVRTYAQATAGTPLRCGSTPPAATSSSATGPTRRSTRRPGSSSARCTTRTATPCGSPAGGVVDRSCPRGHGASDREFPGDSANR